MALRVERKLTGLDLETHEMLSGQIKVLEEHGDPKSVLDRDELRELQILGHAKYLAHLRQVREALGKEDLGE